MKRLTKCLIPGEHYLIDKSVDYFRIIKRLGQYEDTRLVPKQITKLYRMLQTNRDHTELIHCSHCMHCHINDVQSHYCHKRKAHTEADDFCKYAIMRGD